MVLTRFDPRNGSMQLENAGHNYPLLYRKADRKSTFQEMIGNPLGVRKKASRETIQFSLEEGDVVLFFTNGFVECPIGVEEYFGDEAFQALFDRFCHEGRSPQTIADELMKELHRRRIPGPLVDDVTLVVIKRETPLGERS